MSDIIIRRKHGKTNGMPWIDCLLQGGDLVAGDPVGAQPGWAIAAVQQQPH